jgi:hypothetical protein
MGANIDREQAFPDGALAVGGSANPGPGAGIATFQTCELESASP